MDSKPLVSVVIPFLNTEKFIQEAIDSVFAQTYDNWELLLVDDGSTDTSTEIALHYAKLHPEQVSYLEHPDHHNRGASASRNLGSSHAKGEYIAFLDADDIWLPRKLEQQVAILEAQPEVAMVYGPGLWWYSWTGNPEDRQRDYVQDLAIEPDTLIKPPDLIIRFLRYEDSIPSSFAILIRRDVLDRVGGSEEACRSIYDDQIVFAKVSVEAPVYISGECWYWYRQHSSQRVHVTDQKDEYHAVRLAFLKWLQEYLSRQGVRQPELWATLHLEFGLNYLACGDIRQSAKSLNEALQYNSLGPDDFTSLSKKVAGYALTFDNGQPLQFVHDLFEPIRPTAQARRLRRKVLGQLNADLAFRHHQGEASSPVWRHALGAVINDPSWLRNRGLMRIGLEGLLGSEIIGHRRSARQ